jgi:hypothetical protein
MHAKCWSENLTGRDHMEDLGIDRRTILKWEDVDWIHLAEDKVQWWAVGNMVINLQLP